MSNGIFKLKQVSESIDGVNCPLDPQQLRRLKPSYVYIDDDKVIFASKLRLLKRLLRNLQRDGEFDRTSNEPTLLQWQSYRQGSLFAVQFFITESVKQNPITNLVLNAVSGDAVFNSIGMRAETALVSRGVRLEADGFSLDLSVLENAKTIIERGIRSRRDDGTPSLANLMSNFSVATGDSVKLSVTLNSDLLQNTEELVSDFLGELFGGIVGDERDIDSEKINSVLWDYNFNPELVDALTTGNGSQSSPVPVDRYTPLFEKGRAAIFVDFLGVKPVVPFSDNSEEADAAQVALRVTRQVPATINAQAWGEFGVIQRLMITGVSGGDGQQLIADEHCRRTLFGQEKNQQASAQSNLTASMLETSKSVRLSKGSSIDDIARVKGWSDIAIPTQVEKITLSMDALRDADWGGGSLRLQSIKGSAVSYKITGEQNNFISLRGLNASGQVLTDYSSMSSDNKVVKTFAGQVALVDVFVATDWYEDTIEFEVDSLTPRKLSQQTSAIVKDQVSLFTKSDQRNFSRALKIDRMSDDERVDIEQQLARQGFSFDALKETEIGRARSKSAHLLFKHDPESKWQKQLQGLVVVPFEPAILLGYKSLILMLNIDGEAQDPVVPRFSASSVNGRYLPDFESSKRGYLLGTFTLELDHDRNGVQSRITEIDGTLDYRFPTSVSTMSIDLKNSESSSALKLQSIEYGLLVKTTYLIDRSVSHVYSAKLFTADGGEYRADVGSDSEGNITLAFSTDEQHQKIELYRTKDSFEKSENFSLKPRYK